MKELRSMSQAVIKVINGYAVGHQYHGNELYEDVSSIYPPARKMYPDTLMRMMRRHCNHQYKTIDHNKSCYEKI